MDENGKKEKKSGKNGSPGLKARFRYWFDNRMANGSLGLIRVLLIATALVIVLIAGAILLFHFAEDSEPGGVFWETMSTVINAWMPSFEDGSVGYIVLMALAAIAGLLVTSVLIGIFSSAIEEKITNLKNGNSAIIEKDHIVVLGYEDGEFTLIQQLVDASADDRRTVALACGRERSEVEDALRSNLDIPKNIRLVCRNIDIYDPADLRKCCIEQAQAVIVSPGKDADTVRALLAVSAVLGEDHPDVYVCSAVSKSRFLLPDEFTEKHNVTQLLSKRLLSKVIAHSCTQPGLSETLTEFLDYDGCNLYEVSLPEAEGKPFGELTVRTDGGVPMGLFRGKDVLLNPDADEIVRPGDRLLIFTDDPGRLRMDADAKPVGFSGREEKTLPGKPVLILGVNEETETVLRELPDQVVDVRVAGANEEEKEALSACAESIRREGRPDFRISFVRDTVPKHPDTLAELIGDAAHVVLLNDYGQDEDEADTEVIIRILNLRSIRAEKGLTFNMTAELRRESSCRLAGAGDSTDFVVATNLVSMFLSQLADRPNLEPVFRELLSNEGSELYLKSASELRLPAEISVKDARASLLSEGYVLLGLMDDEDGQTRPVFNPPLDQKICPDENDRLIVLGKK